MSHAIANTQSSYMYTQNPTIAFPPPMIILAWINPHAHYPRRAPKRIASLQPPTARGFIPSGIRKSGISRASHPPDFPTRMITTRESKLELVRGAAALARGTPFPPPPQALAFGANKQKVKRWPFCAVNRMHVQNIPQLFDFTPFLLCFFISSVLTLNFRLCIPITMMLYVR